MGNTLAANHFRDFWKEVKKVNKSKDCANKAPEIDVVSGDPQVTELWSTNCDSSNRDSLLGTTSYCYNRRQPCNRL